MLRKFFKEKNGSTKTRSDLKAILLSKWLNDPSSNEILSKVAPCNATSSLAETKSVSSTTTKTTKKRGASATSENLKKPKSNKDEIPPPSFTEPVTVVTVIPSLSGWWRIRSDRGVTYKGVISDHPTAAAGTFFETNLIESENTENHTITTFNKEIFRLQNSLGGEGAEDISSVMSRGSDSFGPWPLPMTGGNSGMQQMRTNLSGITASVKSRLLTSLSGSVVSDLEASSQIYRMTQIVNAIECRTALIKGVVEASSTCNITDKMVLNETQIDHIATISGVNKKIILDLEELNQKYEQVKACCSSLHPQLFGSKFENDVKVAGDDSILNTMHQARLRVLVHAEKRALRKQEENNEVRVSGCNGSWGCSGYMGI